MIPLPNYEPDRADFAPDASNAFTNCMPVRDGWGPLGQFNAYSQALPAACKGAIRVRKTNGTTDLYAGTALNLFVLNGTDASWTDRTRLTGGDYSVPSGDYWSFTQFQNLLIAVNGNNAPQVIDVDTGTNFADLGGSPDNARYAAVVGYQLGLFSHNADAQRLSLSGYGDTTFWTRFRNGSGRQILAEGGWIQGAVGDQSGAFIFQQDRIQRLTLTPGQAASFRVDEFENARGVVAPGSIVNVGGQIFYKSEDGLYALGQPSRPVGFERIDRFIRESQALDFVSYAQGAADPINKRVAWRMWFDSTSEDSSDQLIWYDYGLDRFARSVIELEYVFPAATQGHSLEGLGSAGLGYTMETLPYSLDSRVWKGGRPTLGAFNSEHKLGFFEGTNYAATLETADMALAGEHRRAFVQGFRPVCDADGLSGQVAYKDTIGGTRTWNTQASQDVTGLIPARVSGRQHRFRLDIPAGTLWEHAIGLEPLVRKEGRR